MKTLCMDTAHKNLIVGLYENDRRVCGIAKEAWKRQSEYLFPAIVECMEKAGWDSMDLDEVVITDGPGQLYRRAHRDDGRQGAVHPSASADVYHQHAAAVCGP